MVEELLLFAADIWLGVAKSFEFLKTPFNGEWSQLLLYAVGEGEEFTDPDINVSTCC